MVAVCYEPDNWDGSSQPSIDNIVKVIALTLCEYEDDYEQKSFHYSYFFASLLAFKVNFSSIDVGRNKYYFFYLLNVN